MKYPKLVPKSVCCTTCTVTLFAEGMDEDGAPNAAFSDTLKCCFQSSAKRIMTAKKQEVQLSGEAYFYEDFCPALPEIPDGEIEVFGVKRKIVQGMKARNPDGSVNYILLSVV